jgi:hypothetical protein
MCDINNETGVWCDTLWRETKYVHTGFWWGYLRERDYLEDLGVDGRIILTWVFNMWSA